MLLLLVAIPLLLSPKFQEYALAVIDTASILALAAVLYAMAAARESLSRRAALLLVCAAVVLLAHSIVPEPNRWHDLISRLIQTR